MIAKMQKCSMLYIWILKQENDNKNYIFVNSDLGTFLMEIHTYLDYFEKRDLCNMYLLFTWKWIIQTFKNE